MAAPTTTPPLTVPPEVHAFAAEAGVAPYLPAVLELLSRTFPTARRFAVLVEDDPEIANDRHIVFEVDVPLDGPQARAVKRQWNDGLFACCPAPLVCVFRLSMDLVP
jgi:hypothetical protein